jgi:hypothetical protein
MWARLDEFADRILGKETEMNEFKKIDVLGGSIYADGKEFVEGILTRDFQVARGEKLIQNSDINEIEIFFG